jgi:hypothetical protein
VTFDEAAFRALLDKRGILDGARDLSFPPADGGFLVFAQREDARIELVDWQRHAAQLHATRLGLTVEKTYDGVFPQRDVARVVLAPVRETPAGDGSQGTRTCWGRPRVEADLASARAAEGAAAGLADLAARCPYVWMVQAETDDDWVALRLAAILGGVLLGPIVAPRGAALFGPRTARARLGD